MYRKPIRGRFHRLYRFYPHTLVYPCRYTRHRAQERRDSSYPTQRKRTYCGSSYIHYQRQFQGKLKGVGEEADAARGGGRGAVQCNAHHTQTDRIIILHKNTQTHARSGGYRTTLCLGLDGQKKYHRTGRSTSHSTIQ